MELYEAMRTAFAAREFTGDDVPDEVLRRILDNARFAPSGGNRQGGRIIVVRDQAAKERIAELAEPGARRYMAQVAAGESPWNTVVPSEVDEDTVEATRVPPVFREPYLRAPVLLVVCVDLRLVASLDKELDRVGVVSGASIYPMAWNILLAARSEGYGGTLTTLPIAEEPHLKELLGIPDYGAVCAIIPLGKPVKQLTKLKRRRVDEFVTRERWDGEPY